MAELFQSAISHPYIYALIFAVIVLIVVLILLFLLRKRIFPFLEKIQGKKRLGIKIRKKSSVEFGVGSHQEKNITLKQIDMEDSKIEDISGSVKMNNIKMKKSSIGSIRSESKCPPFL